MPAELPAYRQLTISKNVLRLNAEPTMFSAMFVALSGSVPPMLLTVRGHGRLSTLSTLPPLAGSYPDFGDRTEAFTGGEFGAASKRAVERE